MSDWTSYAALGGSVSGSSGGFTANSEVNSNTSTGDLVVVVVNYTGNVPFTKPGDWEEVVENNGNLLTNSSAAPSIAIFYAIKGAGSLGTSFTRTGGDNFGVSFHRYRWTGAVGTITLGPTSQNTLTTASTAATTAAITTTVADSIVLCIASASRLNFGPTLSGGPTATDPSGGTFSTTNAPSSTWNYRANHNATNVSGRYGDGVKATTGSTGTFTATFAAARCHAMVAVSFYVDTGGGGGASFSIDGAATATLTATGSILASRPLTGTAVALAIATGAIRALRPITGAATAVLTAVGAIGRATPITAAASFSASATGNIGRATPITGAASVAMSATGAIGRSAPLTGAATITASSTGDLGRITTLTGAATITATATGDIGLSVPGEPDPSGSGLIFRRRRGRM